MKRGIELAGKRRVNLYKIVLLLLFVSFIVYLIDNWRIHQDTYAVKNGRLEITINTEATIIKYEKIVYAYGDGVPSFFVQPKTRVKPGQLIGQQFSDYDAKTLADEINMIQEVINIKEGRKIPDDSIGMAYFHEVEQSIQKALFQHNFLEALAMVENLESNDYNFRYSSYERYTTEELKQILESLKKNLSSDKISYYSPSSGLVSFEFDGLEQVYQVSRLEDMNLNDISRLNQTILNSTNQRAQAGDPLFKVVNNFIWYLAFDLDTAHIEINADVRYLPIRLNRIDRVVYGRIIRHQTYGDRLLLIVEISEYLHEYLNDRYINTSIIIEEQEGLMVYQESILYYEGKKGVFVSDANNVVRFRPIRVLLEDDNFAIIDQGEKLTMGARGRIIIDDQTYHTIKIYDSIIRNPENVYDGQILR